MKCPFCGYNSKEQQCEKCFAWIPAEQSKPKDEPKPSRRVQKDNKELKDDGT